MKFVSDDGKVFNSQEECARYEEELQKCFWQIEVKKDGAQSQFDKQFINIFAPHISSDERIVNLYLEDWCHRTFGSSVLFTKHGPTEKYELFKSTKQLYDNKVASHIKLFGEAKIVNEKMDIDIVAMNDVDKGYKETKDMSTYELYVMHEIMNRK